VSAQEEKVDETVTVTMSVLTTDLVVAPTMVNEGRVKSDDTAMEIVAAEKALRKLVTLRVKVAVPTDR